MSIINENDFGWVVSHNDYVSRVYQGKHALKPSLFDIKHPYKIEKKKNKSKVDLTGEIKEIQNKFRKLLEVADCKKIFNLNDCQKCDNVNNTEAIFIAKECTQKTELLQNMSNITGGNTSSEIVYHEVNKCDLIIPQNCRFVCGDVRNTLTKIKERDFDLVVLDPPWWNKYIRRKKSKNPVGGYQMLYNEDVINLPIGNLLSDDAIVAVWCTNCNNHESDIKNKMFPTWGVKYAATWYWIKVTKSGEVVCPFNKPNSKQPFERLLLGVKGENLHQPQLPDGKIFVSIPSALHSHKPPLNDLLYSYIKKEKPQCLEVFARYLLPGTTSVGLEPLRWQHSCLYTMDDDRSTCKSNADIKDSRPDS